MIGFITLILAAGLGSRVPPDSVCLRTTYGYPDMGRSVRCMSAEEYRAWQARRDALRLRQRRERARAAERRRDRREAAERLRQKREDRKREERRSADRRRNER
jgi:hypothetical protein